jgi:long-chain acyl-CoA synthetase
VTSSAAATSGDGIFCAFARHVARRSSDPVVVSPGHRATFGEIDALARTVAERLLAAGSEPGRLVGLSIPNGPAFLAGFLALRRAGQVVLLLDPLAPAEDRRRAMGTLGASGILECRQPWPSSDADFHFTRCAESGGSTTLSGVAVVKLTSGSTGTPRGVAMSTEALLADEDALARTMGFRHDDRLWGAVSLSHSYGFTTLALSALVRGLPLVIPADREPFASLAAARELGTTVFPTVPAYIQGLLKLSAPPSWPATIRLVISAGAILPAATAAQFRQTYGWPVHTFYGSSECGGICYDREGSAAERNAVGTAVDGVRISLRPVPQLADEEGLVVVESPAVGETYLPDSDSRLTSGRFESSDVGAWQGGELALRRRADRVINVRGRKVDPSEVEMVLSALEGVEEVVVIGMASPDGRDEIVRAVIACPSVRPKYRDVAAWCRHRLAGHKVPGSVVFVDAIPRTTRGKIDRSALLALRSREHDSGGTHD